jgi:carboxyl-terminal processing protease
MKFQQYFLIRFIAACSLCCSLSGWAADNNIPVATPTDNTVKIVQPGEENIKPPELPREQVQRFVNAIAIIKHYYIADPSDKTLFDNAIKGMVETLDPHSSYLDADDLKDLETAVSGQFVGIGVELTTQDGALKVISPIEGSPADRAGLKPGDLIIKIDDKIVQNMSLREAVSRIKGKKGTKVNLTIIRKGTDKPINLDVTRENIKLETLRKKMLDDHYGYIRLSFFQGPVDNELIKAIEELKSKYQLRGLILDLRNNPGGLLDVSARVADAFLDVDKTQQYHNLIVYTKGRIPGSDMEIKATGQDLTGGLPLVVLINNGSASASEIVAGALQDYRRAIIMGTVSFGKGSVQTVLPLDSGAIKLTTALYHTPSGKVIQAKGIQPDVVVPALQVDEKNLSGLLDIDEEDYRNHLANGDSDENLQNSMKKYQQERDMEIALAKEDYQLFSAYLMLKGVSATSQKPPH